MKLFVPEGFAEEKCILMRGLGAEVERTPEAEMMAERSSGRWRLRRRRRARLRRCSLRIRRIRTSTSETTAEEIWEQMEGRVDAVVSAWDRPGRSRAWLDF